MVASQVITAPPLYTIRPGTPGDWDLVLSTWLRSHKQHGYGAKWIAHSAYFRHQEPLMKRILGRARLDAAVALTDSDTVFGYIVHDERALHWLYVKKVFRRFGIGSALLRRLAPGVNVYTYRNDTEGAYALIGKHKSASFNPYLEMP